MKQQTQKQSHRIEIILFILILLVAGFIVGFYYCNTTELEIEGCTYYEPEEMTSLLLEPEYTDNTLYLWYYYKFRYAGEIPFVDSVDISLRSLQSATAVIHEQTPAGYVIYADAYVYFDRSGTVIEVTDKYIPDIPRLEGFDFKVLEKDSVLPVEDRSLLDSILICCRQVKQEELPVESIKADDKGDITLYTDRIEIDLGQGEHLEEKISLAAVLLESLEDRTGTLHLEDYDGTNGTRSFQDSVE